MSWAVWLMTAYGAYLAFGGGLALRVFFAYRAGLRFGEEIAREGREAVDEMHGIVFVLASITFAWPMWLWELAKVWREDHRR